MPDDFVPTESLALVRTWFQHNRVRLHISRERISKLGDFRAGPGVPVPVISVNYNLNKYSFLITLLHEMAHAVVWLSHKRKTQPHGTAWKIAFQQVSLPYLEAEVFPPELAAAFITYLRKPTASTMANHPLSRALRVFDEPDESIIRVAELPENTVFRIAGGRSFVKGKKVRTRYRCTCLNNKRIYLFNPLAEVIPETVNPLG